MLNKILLIVLSYVLSLTFSQVRYSKIFEKNYVELPIKVRIDNSGIYSISSFDIEGDTVLLNSFDDQKSYIFENNTLKIANRPSSLLKDFLLEFETEQEKFIQEKLKSLPNKNIKLRKSFLSNSSSLFYDENGILSNDEGDRITVFVINRNELKLNFEFVNSQLIPREFNTNTRLTFPGNLACADFIGMDSKGNIFLLVETILSDIPLKVQREVYTLSKKGEILSILIIPAIKYLYTIRDFQIDQSGNLYHLLCDKEKATIIKWSGLVKFSKEKISYPDEYNYSIHFNDFVTTIEVPTEIEDNIELLASRVEAIRLGEKYVLNKYACGVANLAPNGVIAPDGDDVKTPPWLIEGYNARIPYKWGGFTTLTDFKNGLLAGKYAGDINTDGVSSYAIGVDCSGFVSRCWQMSYHASTSYMPTITTQYLSWDSLKPADAIHKVGHVRLFLDRTSNGLFRVVESAGRNWDVSYWTFTLSDLATYTPRYYNNMVNDYSKQQPIMISALIEPAGKSKLIWNCDTTNLKGFRLYSSVNGESWTLRQDENSLKTTTTIVSRMNPAEYYRVSSVLNNSPTFSESPWSNVLGVGDYSSTKKILIVDGFERTTGSWRGSQHTFVMRYGQALQPFSLNFESVKNNLIENSLISLNDYELIFWILGDESTADETFNLTEQNYVKSYLENGGKLFVSGSEVGWDLYEKGNSTDKAFYNQYLKASYISDNASSNSAKGVSTSCFNGLNFNFGQAYYEDYPDEITTTGGSNLCMNYSNNKGAGITYSGNFGASGKMGKLIYLAFPLETTANDSAFNAVVFNSLKFFFSGSIRLIVEGLYDPVLNRLNSRDTIRAYLRNIVQPYAIVDSVTAVIDSITFTCNLNFSNAQTGTYYLVITHRNCIETWSKSSGVFFIEGTIPDYDFTLDSSQVFGNNQKKIGGKWCIYSGDVDQDGVVDISDVGTVDTDNLNFATGYLVTDVNGDGLIDLSDLAIVDTNNLNFVTKVTPTFTTARPERKQNQISDN